MIDVPEVPWLLVSLTEEPESILTGPVEKVRRLRKRMLSGIVHLNKKHVGFSENEIKAITTEVLEMLYSQEMMDSDSLHVL
ncbi:hypothetical protein BGZ65_012827 [Modicella reniformis]|uniref:Uncharacterized protein n=1 Tax=Modicella reniformis TaxID=1440133 RepID=A0A9P6SNY4_9FUNG|nr:hypothetical protein BGZ65_012827 [Modicella reniformis]